MATRLRAERMVNTLEEMLGIRLESLVPLHHHTIAAVVNALTKKKEEEEEARRAVKAAKDAAREAAFTAHEARHAERIFMPQIHTNGPLGLTNWPPAFTKGKGKGKNSWNKSKGKNLFHIDIHMYTHQD